MTLSSLFSAGRHKNLKNFLDSYLLMSPIYDDEKKNVGALFLRLMTILGTVQIVNTLTLLECYDLQVIYWPKSWLKVLVVSK